MTQARKQPIYGNCKVLDPNGLLLFRCERKKADWYLNRDLAKLVATEPNYTVQLTFTPKGQGHQGQPFYLQDRKNRCVVCGSEEDLTRHHCVPYCYRKYMPEEWARFTSHDILAVCIPCHEEYETHAFAFKQELGEQYGIPVEGIGSRYDKDVARVRGMSNALIKYGSQIPEERKQEMMGIILDYVKAEGIEFTGLEDFVDLDPVNMSDYIAHGQVVCDKVEDMAAFLSMWRQHFIDTMSPKFLPPHWDVDYVPKGVCHEQEGKTHHCREESTT